MSSRVGTLQASPAGRSMWPAVVVASLVMLTIVVTAISLGEDRAVRPQPAFPTGTAANTPSELGAAVEVPAGAAIASVPHVPRHAGSGTAAGAAVGGGATVGFTAGSSSLAVTGTKAFQRALIAWRNAVEAQANQFPHPKPGGGPLG